MVDWAAQLRRSLFRLSETGSSLPGTSPLRRCIAAPGLLAPPPAHLPGLVRRRQSAAQRVSSSGVTTVSSISSVPQGPIDLTVDWTTTSDVVAGRWLTAMGATLLLLALQRFAECRGRARPAHHLVYHEAMSVDVKSLNNEAAELTDRAARRKILPSVSTVSRVSIHGAMRHSTFAGAARRLRPLLAFQAAIRYCPVRFPQASRSWALPLKCFTTYSLIHDDLPALDNDDLRRGKPPATWSLEKAIAILAEDALQTRAFEVLAGLDTPPAATVQIYSASSPACGWNCRRRMSWRPGSGHRERTHQAHAR